MKNTYAKYIETILRGSENLDYFETVKARGLPENLPIYFAIGMAGLGLGCEVFRKNKETNKMI